MNSKNTGFQKLETWKLLEHMLKQKLVMGQIFLDLKPLPLLIRKHKNSSSTLQMIEQLNGGQETLHMPHIQ
jgi:hypothetical protein